MQRFKRFAQEILLQTEGERHGARNAFNLFFGAALGANLGLLGEMPIRDYVWSVVVLAGTVWAIHLVSHARSRLYGLSLLALYSGALVYWWFSPGNLLPGLGVDQAHRVIAMLGVWVGLTIITELTPLLGVGRGKARQEH